MSAMDTWSVYTDFTEALSALLPNPAVPPDEELAIIEQYFVYLYDRSSETSTVSTPHNVGSVLWRLFSTLEVVQYCGGITSVLWGIASVLWGIASVLWGIASVLWGDSFSTVEG